MTEKVRWRTSQIAILGFAATAVAGSILGVWPRPIVERIYAKGLFPLLSAAATFVSGGLPVALFDVVLLTLVIASGWFLLKRRLRDIVLTAATAYLVFWLGWGLNYHRQPLEERLGLSAQSPDPAAIERFSELVVKEVNGTFQEVAVTGDLEAEVARRVDSVVGRIDGVRYSQPAGVKRSLLADPFMRVAGIDGFFNPFGHEAIVNSRVLPAERLFIVAHELAHCRGYADEGEANLVAFLATVNSANPALRYNAWLFLTHYLRSPKFDGRLADGPRRDLTAIRNRVLKDRVEWVSQVQNTTFDQFLRANRVAEGTRSYARILTWAIVSEARWPEFR